MSQSRREFLGGTLGGIAAGLLSGSFLSASCAPEKVCGKIASSDPQRNVTPSLDNIRDQFELDWDYVHLAGLLISSNPRPIRDSIERYRLALDENAALYLKENMVNHEEDVRYAASRYLGTRREDIALTDSTTMGIALVYHGLRLQAGDEVLTTEHDYYSTHQSLKLKENQSAINVRKIRLFENIQTISEEKLINRLREGIRAETRALALTWVHSSTGLKLPIQKISAAIKEVNRQRSQDRQILICLDGVHGLGVEDIDIPKLGCDFFMAGTHKWLHGPRGSGIIWGNPERQNFVGPTIPTFSRKTGWGSEMTPGGFKSFESYWSTMHAFDFHRRLGRKKITEKIHSLSRRLKQGLSEMEHVTLYTPLDQNLSAGIISFDIRGRAPGDVVRRLLEHRIVASTTPYTPSYARITPGIYNTEAEMEYTLRVIAKL
jgi:isopenicillin-N epimerase